MQLSKLSWSSKCYLSGTNCFSWLSSLTYLVFLIAAMLYHTQSLGAESNLLLGPISLSKTEVLTAEDTTVSSELYNEYSLYLPLLTRPHQWQSVGQKPEEVDSFFAAAACDEHILGGTEQGIYIYQNDQWQRETAVPAHTVYSIIFQPESCNDLYLTTRGDGLWQGHYNGAVWTWVRVDNGEVDSALTVMMQGEILYVGGDFGLKWSGDGGQSWQMVFTSPTIRLSHDSKAETLLAAVWNSGVFYQDPSNQTNWQPVGTIDDPLVYEAAASDDGSVIAGTQSGLFVWNNAEWTAVSEFPQTTFTTATVNGILYAGQRHTGVLLSSDGGIQWRTFNHGLVMSAGQEFQVRDIHSGRDGFLYIATTNGIWQWSEPISKE